jgi:hypothetical protein
VERPSPRTAAAVRPAGALLLPLSEDLRGGTGGPALVTKLWVEMLLLLLLSVRWFDGRSGSGLAPAAIVICKSDHIRGVPVDAVSASRHVRSIRAN